MNRLLTSILDFLFPPTKEALELRTIDTTNIFAKLPPASHTSLFAYQNPLVKELVWSIKYKKDRHALRCGGYALYTRMREMGYEGTLIPIPISKKRRKERGYNQCELLIEEILKLDTEKKFSKNFDLLIRTKHTERQTMKNREERLEGALNIFGVKITIPLDSRIIIIDDVTTTGSTLREAKKSLNEAGYMHVETLTLAH